MPERQARIESKVGLHARPAALFARAVAATGLPVTIAKEGQPPVSARSLLSLLTLGAEHGDVVTLAADGDDAEATLDGLVAMLERELDD